jgi:hypothetical protein
MKLGAAPLALVVLVLACPSANAQGQPQNARPAATAAPVAAPASTPPKARRRVEHADARVCLEFPTELQVIACSEKYRWAKSR